jgi:hypothetical protein
MVALRILSRSLSGSARAPEGFAGPIRYNPCMNTARRTLGCWILSVFLERGCDPTTLRIRRPVRSIRPLSPREMAELNPLAGSLVASTNLLRFPRRP